MIETKELSHITPRLTADEIVRCSEAAEEWRVIRSMRAHMVSEWEQVDRKRRQTNALCWLAVVTAVVLAVIGILAWR